MAKTPAPDRPAEPRTVIVEQAARLLAERGTSALTARSLAQAAGTSTMAVYTYFGSMDEVRRAVRREGFARLHGRLTIDPSRDAVADLARLGWAYYRSGTEDPHLYRAMFLEEPVGDDADRENALGTFLLLVHAVERCIDEGRFSRPRRGTNAGDLALQTWTMTHGALTLEMASLLDRGTAVECLAAMAHSLFVGFGDDPAAAARSIKRARAAEQVD